MRVEATFVDEDGRTFTPAPFKNYEVVRTIAAYWTTSDPEDSDPDSVVLTLTVARR